MPSPPASWEAVARKVQSARDNGIAKVQPPIPSLLTDKIPSNVTAIPAQLLEAQEIEITESPPEILTGKLASGTWSSRKVTKAFLRRAAVAQNLTNCLTSLLPAFALERADYLDSCFATNKSTVGPLHGLPISVKECVGIKDQPWNAGFVAWVGKVANEDALVLQILWEAGAVFYARTTEPQSLMHLETSSNLFGTTVNPYNRNLTPGGSSGGEGALIGLHGSCLGVGRDIGGSIRVPAANCGLYGLRPTSYRIPQGGVLAPHLGSGYISPVVGPLSSSLEGVKLFMRTVIGAKPWIREPSLVPIPWWEGNGNVDSGNTILNQREEIDTEKGRILRVGVMYTDELVTPHPPIQRAIREMVRKMESMKGVEVMTWHAWNHTLAWEFCASFYHLDGGAETRAILATGNEPSLPLTKWILDENPYSKVRTAAEVLALKDRMEQYKLDYNERWNSSGIDVLLCPVGPGAAPPLGCSRYWGYTSVWNLLDYPALVFPVSRVDLNVDGSWNEDEGCISPTNENEMESYNVELYRDPEIYRDAPISLQLVGRRYEDEKLIEALEYIKKKVDLPRF